MGKAFTGPPYCGCLFVVLLLIETIVDYLFMKVNNFRSKNNLNISSIFFYTRSDFLICIDLTRLSAIKKTPILPHIATFLDFCPDPRSADYPAVFATYLTVDFFSKPTIDHPIPMDRG
jgi:hypothetical protein